MPQQLDLYSRITTKHNILPEGRNNVSSKHNPILWPEAQWLLYAEGWKGHHRSTKKSLKFLHFTLPLSLLAAIEPEYLFLCILWPRKKKKKSIFFHQSYNWLQNIPEMPHYGLLTPHIPACGSCMNNSGGSRAIQTECPGQGICNSRALWVSIICSHHRTEAGKGLRSTGF